MGMGIGQIPFMAIEAYARRSGINDPDEFSEFERMVRVCDNAFIDYVASQQGK